MKNVHKTAMNYLHNGCLGYPQFQVISPRLGDAVDYVDIAQVSLKSQQK